MTKSNRGSFSNQGDTTLKTDDPIWPVFELRHLRFHPGPPYLQILGRSIKTEQCVLMTKSNRLFSAIN